MLKWVGRDWVSATIGWASAFLVLWLVPEACPWKLASIFVTGFCMTWIVRG